jgi:hypothetical protein
MTAAEREIGAGNHHQLVLQIEINLVCHEL